MIDLESRRALAERQRTQAIIKQMSALKNSDDLKKILPPIKKMKNQSESQVTLAAVTIGVLQNMEQGIYEMNITLKEILKVLKKK